MQRCSLVAGKGSLAQRGGEMRPPTTMALRASTSRPAAEPTGGGPRTTADGLNQLARSRPLILDPLAGHDAALRHVEDRSFRETVKELAQLDGAFVVGDDGTFVSAARFIEVTVQAATGLPAGLGARHAAAMSIAEE